MRLGWVHLSMNNYILLPILESILNPPWDVFWSWGQCGCHRGPPFRPNFRSAEFRASVVLNHSCYVLVVRIGLAVGSLPNPKFKIGTVPSLSACLKRGFSLAPTASWT